jgi:hypothetical protein
MDHADWMERQHESIRALAKTSKVYARKAAALPHVLSDFQKRVVDIMGIVGGGIYNAPVTSWDWDYGWGAVSVLWKRELTTFDFDSLTALVVLCHEARIRLCINSAGPRMMRLTFWQREADGGLSKRHPNIDEAVAALRRRMPANHRIFYRSRGCLDEANQVTTGRDSMPANEKLL